MFPLMVARGQITQEEADSWIDILKEIWHDYDEEKNRRQRTFMFGNTPGRITPPIAPSKKPVTLPKVNFLDGDN